MKASRTPARAPRRAFSLLEVMVSVAILGLVLTVILSAQAGLAASNKVASNMGMAITVGRCKMTEAEERLIKLGYPEIDQVDKDVPCCEDTESQGFTCDVRVEKIELPSPPQNSLGDGGAALSLTPPAGSAAGTPGAAGIGQLLNNPAGGASLNLDGGLQSLGAQVAQQAGVGAALSGGGGAEGLLNMVMGFVYPSMKLMMEASIRRVTITVHWNEGPHARELALVQYVTNPQRGGFASGVMTDDGGVPLGGGFAGGGAGAPAGGAPGGLLGGGR